MDAPAEPRRRSSAAIDARRARFVERGGVIPPEGTVARALLEAFVASGELLPDLLGADVAALATLAADPWLGALKPAALIAHDVERETAGATDFVDFKRRLRVARRREGLRMGARELGGGTTAEVARELAAFADACLEASVRFCEAEPRRELRPPGPA